MRSLIYSNLTTRKPATSVDGTTLALPSLVAGQHWTIALRFTERVDGIFTERSLPIHSLRASVGPVDQRPETGRWALQVGSGASTGANTIPPQDWNVSATDLAARLNALTGAPDDFQVEWDEGSYIISRTGGQQLILQSRTNTLRPLSHIRIREYQQDGAWRYDVRLIQTSVAFTDSAEQTLPPPPFIETVVDGATGAGGTYFQNEVQNLVVPPDFRGTFYFRRNSRRTELLSEEDGAEEIALALNQLLEPEGGTVTVTNPASSAVGGVARIEFGGDLRGVDLPPLEIVFPPQGSPEGDWTFTLELDKPELWAALRSKDKVTFPFELEARVFKDPADPDAGTTTIKLWSENITLTRPQLWEGLAAQKNIDWMRPRPKDYVPYTGSQVLIGQQQAYTQVVGNGGTVAFAIDHNRNAQFPIVAVCQNQEGGRRLRDSEFEISFDSENSLTIDFSGGPEPYGAPEEEELVVLVFAMGPASAFQIHTHTLAQILGLEDILDDYGVRLGTLESLLPSISGIAAGRVKGTLTIEIPRRDEVLFYRGEEMIFADSAVDASKLPRRGPYLLPALHDATVDDATAVPDSTSGNAGKVYKNNAAPDLLVSPGGRIRSETVRQNEFFACDGRGFFKVIRDAATNTYHPAAFERELFMLFISENMLRVGKTFEVQLGIQLGTVNADSRAQWTLRYERGTAPQDATPSPVGLNLQNIVWEPVPMLEERLIVTPLPTTHFTGMRVARGAAAITCDKMLYGDWLGNNDNAPASANFALRARLTKFDTENSVANATGHLFYRLVGAMEEDGKISDAPPQAVIF